MKGSVEIWAEDKNQEGTDVDQDDADLENLLTSNVQLEFGMNIFWYWTAFPDVALFRIDEVGTSLSLQVISCQRDMTTAIGFGGVTINL